MLAGDPDIVLDQYSAGSARQADGPLMARLGGDAAVSFERGAPHGFRSAVQPAGGNELALGRLEPQERPARYRLIGAVDLEAVVRDG